VTLLVVEKKCGGDGQRDSEPKVTFGHLSPFPYIILRYANVTYKALDCKYGVSEKTAYTEGCQKVLFCSWQKKGLKMVFKAGCSLN
jgi:hypothetical protein